MAAATMNAASSALSITGSEVIDLAAFTILCYEYLLTLHMEIEQFWQRQFSWASVLFFLNRYSSIFFHLPLLCEYILVLLIMRTYALYNRNRKVVIFLSVVAATGGIIGGWVMLKTMPGIHHTASSATQGGEQINYNGCITLLLTSEIKYHAIAWSTVLAFDTIVFLLTLLRALNPGLASPDGLFYIMLQDGTAYFSIIAIFHVANVLTLVVNLDSEFSPDTKAGYQLSPMVVTRMMFNIRKWHERWDIPSNQHSIDRCVQIQALAWHSGWRHGWFNFCQLLYDKQTS
ncbi:hypothetical protein C8Q74DRAFT_1222530 [Fomes fomentarius]|nr:hypothetical protein C8Q74DRAFT_1222530 [Fomes fomentarius]